MLGFVQGIYCPCLKLSGPVPAALEITCPLVNSWRYECKKVVNNWVFSLVLSGCVPGLFSKN
jgi:hypothetical protein